MAFRKILSFTVISPLLMVRLLNCWLIVAVVTLSCGIKYILTIQLGNMQLPKGTKYFIKGGCLMKKMTTAAMKQANGGKRFVCKKCGATFYGAILGKSAAGYHILFNPGHTSFRTYAW